MSEDRFDINYPFIEGDIVPTIDLTYGFHLFSLSILAPYLSSTLYTKIYKQIFNFSDHKSIKFERYFKEVVDSIYKLAFAKMEIKPDFDIWLESLSDFSADPFESIISSINGTAFHKLAQTFGMPYIAYRVESAEEVSKVLSLKNSIMSEMIIVYPIQNTNIVLPETVIPKYGVEKSQNPKELSFGFKLAWTIYRYNNQYILEINHTNKSKCAFAHCFSAKMPIPDKSKAAVIQAGYLSTLSLNTIKADSDCNSIEKKQNWGYFIFQTDTPLVKCTFPDESFHEAMLKNAYSMLYNNLLSSIRKQSFDEIIFSFSQYVSRMIRSIECFAFQNEKGAKTSFLEYYKSHGEQSGSFSQLHQEYNSFVRSMYILNQVLQEKNSKSRIRFAANFLAECSTNVTAFQWVAMYLFIYSLSKSDDMLTDAQPGIMAFGSSFTSTWKEKHSIQLHENVSFGEDGFLDHKLQKIEHNLPSITDLSNSFQNSLTKADEEIKKCICDALYQFSINPENDIRTPGWRDLQKTKGILFSYSPQIFENR